MTAPTPSVIWVVGDGEGDVLHSTTDKDVADEHFQMCVDEPNDFRSGPYTLTEYVPKRDLAAREAELAAMKQRADGDKIVTVLRERAAHPAAMPIDADLHNRASARIVSLNAECFSLAAGQCIVREGGLMGDDHGHQYCDMERQRDEWKRKAEENARDAGRYRLIRSGMSSGFVVTQNIGHDWIEQIADELDAATDAAIAAKGVDK